MFDRSFGLDVAAVSGVLVSSRVLVASAVAFSLFLLFWRRRAKGRGATMVLPNGIEIDHLRKSETELLYNEIFCQSGYLVCDDEAASSVISKLKLVPGDTVVDVGANIGVFATFVRHSCRGAATVHSFECVPSTYDVLARNLARLAAAAAADETFVVKAHPCGLSDREMTATVRHHRNFSIWSTTHQGVDEARAAMVTGGLGHATAKLQRDSLWLRLVPGAMLRCLARLLVRAVNETEEVECRFRRLSDVVFREEGVRRVDLLKVDVEGAELDVLRGIDDAHWPHIMQCTLETESLVQREAIVELLESKGFVVSGWTNGEIQKMFPSSEVGHVFATRLPQ